MENAADALKMAAAILIFIIAIASSFSLFGTAKQTADSIILMRDKQSYLEASEEKVGGILYISSNTIANGKAFGVTTSGDRVVEPSDVVSTIYRYSKEKYGVTIIKSDGTVLARFDSNTENVMNQWYNIVDGEDITADEQKINYTNRIKENISIKYLEADDIDLNLETLYAITVDGNNKINCGAPWYGNETEIRKRITVELSGGKYSKNGQEYTKAEGLMDILNSASQIIEVTNEIDNSKYLEDESIIGDDKSTSLLQQYEMPTVEIVYIIN